MSEVRQHSLTRSVILHLLPGVFILAGVYIVTLWTTRYRLPDMLVGVVVIGLVLIPLELGYLLYRGWKRHGRFSLRDVVRYRSEIPVWQYIALTVPIIIWILFVFAVISPPIDNYLTENVFQWLPSWMTESANADQLSLSVMLIIWFFVLLTNGIFGPFVEELYFRGYLLPRIARFGWWAPLLNTVLFSLYHFFSPWQNPARILALIPMVYAVYWKKNIRLGIIIHCGVNSIGMFAMLPDIIGSA